MKNMDFVWKTPLKVQIGDGPQGESCWKRSTYGGRRIKTPCWNNRLEVNGNFVRKTWTLYGRPP